MSVLAANLSSGMTRGIFASYSRQPRTSSSRANLAVVSRSDSCTSPESPSELLVPGLALSSLMQSSPILCRQRNQVADPDDHCRDVIVTAALLGQVDHFPDCLGRAGLERDLAYLLVLEIGGQAVGAEHPAISFLDQLDVDIRLDGRLRAYRAGDDVFIGGARGLFFGDTAHAPPLLHQGVVQSDLAYLLVPDQVGTAIADLGDIDPVAHEGGNRQRRSHSGELLAFARVVAHDAIGHQDRVFQGGLHINGRAVEV